MKHLSKCGLLLLAILIFHTNLIATPLSPKIRSINFSQTKNIFSTSYILSNLSIKTNDILDVNKLKSELDVIKSLFIKDCYYLTSVTLDSILFTPDSSWVDLFFTIDVREKILLKKIEVIGNTIFKSDYIVNKLFTSINSCLVPSQLETDIENLLKEYESKGYPFTSISIQTKVDSNALILILEIDESEKTEIAQIRIVGNYETKSEVIVRETRVKIGELYDAEKIRNIQSQLIRLKLFDSVDEAQIILLPDSLQTKNQNIKSYFLGACC